MFSKKITPDFTPRKVHVQKPVKYTPPPQSPTLPERILISESTLPPLAPVPKPPPIMYQALPHQSPKPVMAKPSKTPTLLTLASTDNFNNSLASFSPSLETFVGNGESYYALAGQGGGGSGSNWSEFPALSTLQMAGYDIIDAGAIQGLTADISTITTTDLLLNGNSLNTAGEELLFNGEPIATVSSIGTTIAAWAEYVAISTIMANNNDITGVADIEVSTINGQAYTVGSWVSTASSALDMASFNIAVSSLTGVSSINGAAFGASWSQFPATSEVNFAQYNLNNVSTINGQPYTGAAGGPAAWSEYPATQTVDMNTNSLNKVSGVSLNTAGEGNIAILTASAGGILNVNGQPVSTGGGANTWANYPAISSVTLLDQNLNMNTTTQGVSYKDANINANLTVGNTSQAPLRPDATFYVGGMNVGGLANPVTNMNVYSLGGVNINSATGVAVSGGGGVSISGAGGVAIQGVGNLSLTGGDVEVAGAGGVFVNGTGAITVTAGGVFVQGGGVAVSAGGCAITAGGLSVAGGAVTIGTAGLAGGDLTIYGGALKMASVGGITNPIQADKIEAVTPGNLAITGVSTINGSPLTYISTGAGTYQGVVRIQAGTNLGLISDIPGGNLTLFAPDNSFVKSVEGPTGGPITGPVEFVAGSGIEIVVSESTFTFTNTRAAAGPLGTLEYSDGSGGFLDANDLIYTASGIDHAQSFLTVNGNILPLSTSQNTIGTSSNIWANVYTDNLQVQSNATIPALTAPVIYDAFDNPGVDGQFLGWASSATRWQTPTPPIALTNKVIANSVGTPAISTLTWTTGQAGNQYVPLAADTSVTYRAPIAPQSGQTGWRFTKTYALLDVHVTGLVTGSTYTIVTPGSTNWTSIGALASTAGTQFTYNGVTITGNNGTATESSKISWYCRDTLYGLALPVLTPPLDAFSKANLRSAWFLVRFNADIALQGSLAIQIETYAYQYTFPGPTYPSYTGRWAYSFPLQQGVGFGALTTTNISTTTTMPRLRSGFTYLLYAGDYSSVGMPGPYLAPSNTFLAGGAGLFGPSQAQVDNTLKDPYDIYPEYPHIGLTSCLYTANATQPPYGGANPYSDQAAVEVASIYLNTSSTAPYAGVGQTVTDFNLLAMGYTTNAGSFSFPVSWVP